MPLGLSIDSDFWRGKKNSQIKIFQRDVVQQNSITGLQIQAWVAQMLRKFMEWSDGMINFDKLNKVVKLKVLVCMVQLVFYAWIQNPQLFSFEKKKRACVLTSIIDMIVA